MLLQVEPTANTTAYMIAGYAVIFGIMLIYVASLVIRYRNLRQDIETLEELADQPGEPVIQP